VVDPGVGTSRRGVAVEASGGRLFVGPDNGLLSLAVAECGGAVRAVSLENEMYQLTPVSDTFHGRDIFAPAAAYLANGGALSDLGPEIDPGTLVSPVLPSVDSLDGEVHAEVWNVDRFGNAALWLSDHELRASLGEDIESVELALSADRYRYYADVVRTFANVRPGGLLVYVDPYNSVSLAVNKGNAAAMLRLKPGSAVTIARAPDGVEASFPPVASGRLSV
jgi:S-adenosylmethionine hydrolase